MHRRALLRLAALSPAALLGLHACTSNEGAVAGAELLTLNDAQFAVLSDLCDQLLPRTTTLGAVDVGVPEFIDRMLMRLLTGPERREAVAVLDGLRTAGKADLDDLPPDFFLLLKRMALLGYFTSERVMTEQLDFHPAPGHYASCVPADRLFVNLNFSAE